ncbi:MAG: hypothetical protein HYT46_00480 [Candidatus Vogelbacteria bacterium]|nr:hypothetical protein [Candidatus Vogelbacteria bacterium]
MTKSKCLLFIGLAAWLMLAAVSQATAQTPSADTRQNIRDQQAGTIELRIQNYGDRLELRLTAALQRADNLRARVADRIGQFRDPKFDKALVEQKLTEAATAIAAGRAKVTTIDAEVTKALAVTNKTTAFANLRTAVREIIGSVRLAHQKVVEAIRLIKSAYPITPPVPPPASTNQ